MKRWVLGPLLDVNAINDRLDAIEELERANDVRQKFRN